MGEAGRTLPESLPYPPPLGFSRQEYWSALPFPSPDLPELGIEPSLLHCRQILYHLSYQGSLEEGANGLIRTGWTEEGTNRAELGMEEGPAGSRPGWEGAGSPAPVKEEPAGLRVLPAGPAHSVCGFPPGELDRNPSVPSTPRTSRTSTGQGYG